jgi:Tol biopolymer transport system component
MRTETKKQTVGGVVDLKWSPDGTKIVYSGGRDYHLAIYDLTIDKEILLSDPEDDTRLAGEHPLWHPDSDTIFYFWASRLESFSLLKNKIKILFTVEDYHGYHPSEIVGSSFAMSHDGSRLFFVHKKEDYVELCSINTVAEPHEVLNLARLPETTDKYLFNGLSWLTEEILIVQGENDIYGFDVRNRELRLLIENGREANGNGKNLMAFSRYRDGKAQNQFFVFEFETRREWSIKLNREDSIDYLSFNPAWSPDGKTLAFQKDRHKNKKVGSNPEHSVCLLNTETKLVVEIIQGSLESPATFSPEASKLAMSVYPDFDITLVDLEAKE